MPHTTAGRPPGRPKSQAKRQAILTAARDLLLEHGYRQTSMEMIAAAAGVSKPTVYSHFGSKEELFDAIIAVRREEMMARMGRLSKPSADPRADLEQFAFLLQGLALTPSARRWDRLVIAEAGRHPELAQTLFRAGPANLLALIQRYLDAQTAAGRLQIDDTELAAEHLLGLCLSVELVRGQMVSQPHRSEQQQRERARAAVAVFLAAYGTSTQRGDL